MGSYVPCSLEETVAELASIGRSSIDALYQAVPKEVYLKGAYAMALITKGAAKVGDTVEVHVRGRKVACEVVALPFYKR